jgi:toxin ParE1/3/4
MGEGKRRLVWSRDAEDDLLSIWRYGAEEWSPTAADDHERAIGRSCLRLVSHPDLGKSRDELFVGMRSIPIDPHVVFYKVSSDAIEVVRVIHQREDIESIFS